jgi:hypothetical protein
MIVNLNALFERIVVLETEVSKSKRENNDSIK